MNNKPWTAEQIAAGWKLYYALADGGAWACPCGALNHIDKPKCWLCLKAKPEPAEPDYQI